MQSNSWATKLFTSLSAQEQTNINTTHQHKLDLERQQEHAKDLEKRARIYKKWQRIFYERYGVYWIFYVEDTCYDFPLPTEERLKDFNRESFARHLVRTFGPQWMWNTADTQYDCAFIRQKRDEICAKEALFEKILDAKDFAQDKRTEEIKNQMKAKVWLKEITQAQYDDWYSDYTINQDYGDEMDDWCSDTRPCSCCYSCCYDHINN